MRPARGGRPERAGGVTLVELMVALALATILVATASYIFMVARRLYDRSLEEIATANELRFAFERLGRDLRGLQPARLAGWEPRLEAVDAADGAAGGAEDVLTFVTLEGARTGSLPVRVTVRLGPRDADGLAPLTRRVTERWDVAAQALTPATDPLELVLPRVRGLRVAHAWVTDDVTQPHAFLRGAAAALPSASTGARFALRGQGTLAAGVLDLTSAPWDAARPVPRRLAHTLLVTGPAGGPLGAYPVLEVVSPTRLVVAGAPDGPVELVVPLTPEAFEVTIEHEGRHGPRSLTMVLAAHP
ncbi:MAG: prepilin-type N-terminal cleavage/methylation domain-containing protein [Planctomycetes bacterium]|nr:prepilin-type N-terminal cleavage/methylation domain-containing protein [Planctomycetota bacterium]